MSRNTVTRKEFSSQNRVLDNKSVKSRCLSLGNMYEFGGSLLVSIYC